MCGIFGIASSEPEVSKLVYLGLYALQHRGQESAGIAVVNAEKQIDFHKGMGLVNQVFNENILRELQGAIAIGHVRYSTTGSSQLKNAQPILVELPDGVAMLAHNGNLVNTMELRHELEADGFEFSMSSDSELIGCLLKKHYQGDLVAALAELAPNIKGAFSLVIMTQDKIVGMRDPYGIRPLCIGSLPGGRGNVIASESCALDIVGAELLRDVEKGEIVTIDLQGIKSFKYDQTKCNGLCVFEFIYFARPDSIINGRGVYSARVEMGKRLYAEHPIDADIVIPVPDSGIPAAIGFAQASGIPYAEGLIKNRYVGRTFISPSQLLRELGVKIKLNPLRDVLQGKRVVVIDDSIVRGTTSAKIVKLLRDAGAKEVHFRISAPPSVSPCYYGIDTATKEELIAANYTVPQIQEMLKADSLGYLSIPGVFAALGADENSYCLGCFSGKYPAETPEELATLQLIFNKTK